MPTTSNTSAGTIVQAAQAAGTSAAKTQNPQDLANATTSIPTLTGLAGAFGPAAGTSSLASSLTSLDAVTVPTLNALALGSGGPAGSLNAASAADAGNVLVNDLARFSTYTYAFSFEVAKPNVFNKMIDEQKYTGQPDWQSIIKTGGLGPTKPKGDDGTEYFTRDLYIDNLRLKTIVGMSPISHASNVISINFTITEPYGASFIDDLFDFVTNGLKQANYLEMCYLLKIDFVGYNEDGSMELLTKHRKYIPCRLINITFSINAGGAVYEVEALPFNHMAKTEQYGRVDKDTSIEGLTLAELTASGPKSLANSFNAASSLLVAKNQTEAADTYKIEFVKVNLTGSNPATPNPIDIGGYGVVNLAEIDRQAVPMTGDGKETNARITGKINSFQNYKLLLGPTDTAKPGTVTIANRQQVNFKAGSSIIDVLENLIKSSRYITNQIDDYMVRIKNTYLDASGKLLEPPPSDAEIAEKLGNISVNWFRIIPVIKFREFGGNSIFDRKQNRYAKEITFRVVPYVVYSNKSSVAGRAYPTTRIVKKYDYIYTGKNTEIINFDIKFDVSFMSLATFNARTQELGEGFQTALDDFPSAATPVGTAANPVDAAHSRKPTPGSPSSVSSAAVETPARAQAGDLASSLYNPADMVTLDLEILGDPDYIKQDDIFLLPSNTNGVYDQTSNYTPAGAGTPATINFDSGEIYFQFVFYVPQDYDLETGRMNIDHRIESPTVKRNMFSGLYRIITAESTFSGGTFKQKIEGYRLPVDQIVKPAG